MYKIKFSPNAIADAQAIKVYIEQDLENPKAAIRTVSRIMKRIRTLSDFPKSGPMLSSIAAVESRYRFLVCGNYTAFYRIEKEEVYIVRILYGRRDFMRILFGEPENTEES